MSLLAFEHLKKKWNPAQEKIGEKLFKMITDQEPNLEPMSWKTRFTRKYLSENYKESNSKLCQQCLKRLTLFWTFRLLLSL